MCYRSIITLQEMYSFSIACLRSHYKTTVFLGVQKQSQTNTRNRIDSRWPLSQTSSKCLCLLFLFTILRAGKICHPRLKFWLPLNICIWWYRGGCLTIETDSKVEKSFNKFVAYELQRSILSEVSARKFGHVLICSIRYLYFLSLSLVRISLKQVSSCSSLPSQIRIFNFVV